MNILVVNDRSILEQLVQQRILKPFSGKEYRMNVHGFDFKVYAEIDDIPAKPEEKETKKLYNAHINKSEIKKYYNDFNNAFPNSDRFDGFPKSRTLKSDPNNLGFRRYCALIQQHNITPEQIKSALDYEVYYRKKESRRVGDNQMKYMRASAAWLNDVVNINTQLEELANDKDYKNNPDGLIEENYDDL